MDRKTHSNQKMVWDETAIADLRQRRARRETLEKIAAAYGLTRSRVSQVIHRWAPDVARLPAMARQTRQVTCYLCGGAYPEGSRMTHVKQRSHKQGLMAAYGPYKDILADYKAGVPVADILEKHNVTAQQMYRILRHDGMPKRGYNAGNRRRGIQRARRERIGRDRERSK